MTFSLTTPWGSWEELRSELQCQDAASISAGVLLLPGSRHILPAQPLGARHGNCRPLLGRQHMAWLHGVVVGDQSGSPSLRLFVAGL